MAPAGWKWVVDGAGAAATTRTPPPMTVGGLAVWKDTLVKGTRRPVAGRRPVASAGGWQMRPTLVCAAAVRTSSPAREGVRSRTGEGVDTILAWIRHELSLDAATA